MLNLYKHLFLKNTWCGCFWLLQRGTFLVVFALICCNGHLPIINLMNIIFNGRTLINYSASIGIFHLLKISLCDKVVLHNLLLKTINGFPIGYRDTVFLKRETMLPRSLSYYHVTQPCCKTVTINYLTKVFFDQIQTRA